LLPETVIEQEVLRQAPVPLLRVLERHGVAPLPSEGLDEPLCLAVGSGRVRPGANVPQPVGATGLGERPGDVDGAIVAPPPACLACKGASLLQCLHIDFFHIVYNGARN